MTTLEQLRALAMQGIGRLNAEATIGRRMTAEELAEFRKAQTVKALRDRAAKDKKRAAPVLNGNPRGEGLLRAL